MPTVGCNSEELWKALGKKYTKDEFEQLCFDFGIELDEVVEEKDAPDTYKIDIPANRYDLLCIEGITRSLRVYLGLEAPPKFTAVAPKKQRQVLEQTPATEKVRAVVLAAVLRDVTFTQESYKSFIDLQDKLHHNICRRRTLVSIGTHDLDTVQGPFLYDARPRSEIKFVPLNKKKAVNVHELYDDILQNDLHLKPYLDIIKGDLYPVIYDKKGTVLSLPPVINGDVSKITLNTKNVFIEITATDHTKAHIVLNTMVAMFSQYCKDKFTVEQVEIKNAKGKKSLSPDLTLRDCMCDVSYVNRILGLELKAEEMTNLLSKMCLSAKLEGEKLRVTVPITRSDILHACDVVEDVGIAYGFNNLPVAAPPTVCLGKQNELNRISDKLRLECALAGFTEILTLSLCSKEENFKNLNHEDDGSAVVIANPKTIEFQVGRTNLLVGMLKTLNNNRKLPLPLKLFEVSDVMFIDKTQEVGASNERHLVAGFYGKRSGFEDIHGLVDRLMMMLGVGPAHVPSDLKTEQQYFIKECNDPLYLANRAADLILVKDGKEQKVGSFGILHPHVLQRFALNNVCSAFEMNIEPFL
uniref:phenylalanine--tRNA ligase n=1 Tax=Paramoeba aestuarina TaxID=180227 RepID=A0A7S4KGU1_9EUKA|mmetsp:Transcript_1877/g.2859  ORF Transcript_1877/g.2859 Transcript_1877/m.2859 type:complete len:582 (+) Transcript_1877:66-1811(+)|eukprot:CAMPEP_0201513348 /NCGR_PEP_ID=MMETSP0161_2-20130828/5419_1 /ASSEMBLY_ACC=CAM_ASM_000251 /TAXON_ID=180227 /ORGANISM="Neoparamoeba aestuarina, Strain SoJaBio B1-5/56/2" /LENGTH=581 /DNA_ID=CAMNT_0047909521 /DNA_START=16 /DNA_END=1761 /DNA_ORIENTATION=+